MHRRGGLLQHISPTRLGRPCRVIYQGANVFCDLYAMVGVVRSHDMLTLLTVSREKTDVTDYDRA